MQILQVGVLNLGHPLRRGDPLIKVRPLKPWRFWTGSLIAPKSRNPIAVGWCFDKTRPVMESMPMTEWFITESVGNSGRTSRVLLKVIVGIVHGGRWDGQGFGLFLVFVRLLFATRF